MNRIILDTDIDTDCDDAGALAVLHGLAACKKIEIAGMICSIPLPACVRCVRAINRWYKRDDIPVGLIDSALWQHKQSWRTYCAHRKTLGESGMLYNESFPDQVSDGALESIDAVRLYRALLAQSTGKSVTICCIGTLTAVAALLASAPDDISSLSGRDLIEGSVHMLVCMAGANYPESCDGFNWGMDRESAAAITAGWPTKLVVQPHGEDVLTGRAFMAQAPVEHPVSAAYRIWLRSQTQNRASWDQLTVLYAVNGPGALFKERNGLSVALDPQTGINRWTTDGGKHVYLEREADAATCALEVESAMIASLAN